MLMQSLSSISFKPH